MRNLIPALVLMPALALTACGGGGSDDSTATAAATESGKEFVLPYGESIDAGSLSITFVAVLDDSRCPDEVGIECVWEGNAQIQLSVTNGQISDFLELDTHEGWVTFATFDGHVIELLGLTPSHGSAAGTPGSYQATLAID